MCAPETVATGVGCPQGLAIVGNDLFVCNFCGDQVMRVDKNGGGVPETIAMVGGCSGLATDGTYLYVGEYNADTLTRMGLDGSNPTVLHSGGGVHGVGLDNGQLYWTEHDAGLVRRAPNTGMPIVTPETLAQGLDRPSSVAADGDTVVFTDYGSGDVYIQVAGETQTLSSGHVNPFYEALDADYVYFTDYDTTNSGEMKIFRAPRDMSSPTTTIAELTRNPSGIILDEGHIYFALASPGAVARIPIPPA
jgi:hypothetical protein